MTHKTLRILTCALLGFVLLSSNLLAGKKKPKKQDLDLGTQIQSLLKQGNEATRNNNLKKAEQVYGELHLIFQGDYSSYFNLGQLYKAKKNTAKAKAMFQEALARNPLNSGTHLQLALIALDEQSGEAFKGHAQEFLRLDPDHKVAAEFAKVLVQSFGMKDLQLREGGWMGAAEAKAWSTENARWAKAFPVGTSVNYLMEYNALNRRWTRYDGEITVTLESVTMRFGTPVATFVLTEAFESNRFFGLKANESVKLLVEPSGTIPVLVADQMSYLIREGRALMSHNVFLLGESNITARSFVGWEAGSNSYQDNQIYKLPLQGYEGLKTVEKTAIFGGVGVGASDKTLGSISQGGGMMVPAGINSEVTQFFSAWLMSRNVSKEYNFPIVGSYLYPHRAGSNVSKWGVDFTGTVLLAPEVSQASRGGGKGTNLTAPGSASNASIRGESVNEEYYSSQYPFYFDKKKVQMLEETIRKVGVHKEVKVRRYQVEGLDLFIDNDGRPTQYSGNLFTIKEQRQ